MCYNVQASIMIKNGVFPMNYLSIQRNEVYEIEIKKSRFICYLFPIRVAEQATEHLAHLRKLHYKAAHCCYAYILNDNSNVQKMSDDGEPTGTAGVPMLEVLKQRNLTYILAVVVRYFGGTKLGAGGLIRAYGQAVSETLNRAIITQNISQMIGTVTVGYHQVDSFLYYLTQTDLPLSITTTEYNADVVFHVAIHVDLAQRLEAELIERFNGQVQFNWLGEQTLDIPYDPTKS